ncbi:MAG TPA: hypothetical protein VEA41_18880, partial [Salinarimonas sp.]|nr:hypothetical protein [Salinarimonas sp.]
GDLAQAMGQLGLGQQGMQQGALGQALQYLGQQQGHGLGQADLAASLVRSYLSGENQKAIAAMQTEAQRSMANRQALGQGIGSAGAIIGALLGGGGGGGGGYRTPPFFGFGGGGWGFDPFDPWFGFGGTLSSLGGY